MLIYHANKVDMKWEWACKSYSSGTSESVIHDAFISSKPNRACSKRASLMNSEIKVLKVKTANIAHHWE